jgi:hypothetical protein
VNQTGLKMSKIKIPAPSLCIFRHTLKVLQEVDLDNFPMAKFIVKSSSVVGAPKYLTKAEDLMRIGGNYISPLGGLWPSAEELKLDLTQYTAFKVALTKEISIIQGPPGCGKTFIGRYIRTCSFLSLYQSMN